MSPVSVSMVKSASMVAPSSPGSGASSAPLPEPVSRTWSARAGPAENSTSSAAPTTPAPIRKARMRTSDGRGPAGTGPAADLASDDRAARSWLRIRAGRRLGSTHAGLYGVVPRVVLRSLVAGVGHRLLLAQGVPLLVGVGGC